MLQQRSTLAKCLVSLTCLVPFVGVATSARAEDPYWAHERSWTGLYIGGFAGAGFETSRTNQKFSPMGENDVGMIPGAGRGGQFLSSTTYDTGIATALQYSSMQSGHYGPASYPNAPIDLDGLANRFSALGGVELGYQRQFGSVVLGIVGDFAWRAKGDGNGDWNSNGHYSGSGINYTYGVGGVDGTTSAQVYGESQASGGTSASTNGIGTLRATIGIAGDRFMVYGTGGLAFGQVKMASSANWSDTNTYSCSATGWGNCAGYAQGTTTTTAHWSGSMSDVKTGYAVGGGMAYKFTDNWIGKVEVLYYDLGNHSMVVEGTGTQTVTGTNLPPPNTSGEVTVSNYKVSKRFDDVIGKLGIAYRF